ncbi:MAG: ribokinase [Acetatifactor sp.]|nr:ribokinase [Acetatifactor sp.]
MKVLNFGSLNLDLVYQMEHFIRAGETFAASRLDKFPGGKGLNQSIALARAGAEVYHGGNVGPDGEALVETLRNAGVDTRLIRRVEEVTGHAVIQVDSRGDNSIILYAGANARVTTGQIDQVLEEFAPGDYLILQNEINRVGEIIEKAFDKGMLIVLNPSPMNEEIRKLPLEKVSFFLLNEIEGEELTGKREPGEILDELLIRYPHARIVLTLGGKGSVYADREKRIHQDIYKVEAVDTTAAGDTFTGYFISTLIRTGSCREALDMAARASAIAVSRQGAAPSIPALDEVCGAGV